MFARQYLLSLSPENAILGETFFEIHLFHLEDKYENGFIQENDEDEVQVEVEDFTFNSLDDFLTASGLSLKFFYKHFFNIVIEDDSPQTKTDDFDDEEVPF